MSLLASKVLGLFEIPQILMICYHYHQVFSSGEVVAPLLQGLDDHKEFSIIDVIVSFCRREGGKVICTGMEISIRIFYISTPPEAVREALVMTKKGLAVSGILITGAERNISLSLIKALSCSFPQWKATPFLVKSWSGQASVEKFGMNFR